MPLSGCSNGLVVTALVTLLLLPAQYYVPDLYLGSNEPSPELKQLRIPSSTNVTHIWLPLDLPPLDLFLTVSLILLAFITYICDWIQRKLMQRRITKLNHYLQDCVGRLRSWDARQEQLEATLKMVQNATSEYNLLLYLLLRHHRLGPIARKPPPHSIYDKELNDLNFITNFNEMYPQDAF